MCKTWKRVLSFVVSVSLAVGMVPMSVSARTTEDEAVPVVSSAAQEEAAVEEPATEETVEETATDETVEVTATEETVEEPGTEETVEETVTEETVEESGTEETVEGAGTEETVEETVTEETVEETATEETTTEKTVEEAVTEDVVGEQEPAAEIKDGGKAVRRPMQTASDPSTPGEIPEPTVMELDTAYAVTVAQNGYWLGSFTPSVDGTYEFYTEGTSDSYGLLYSDPELTTQVLGDDDSGESNNFCIFTTLTKSKTYYIMVKDYINRAISTTVKVRLADTYDLSERWTGYFTPSSDFEEGTKELPSPKIVLKYQYKSWTVGKDDYELARIENASGESMGKEMPTEFGEYKAVYAGKGSYHGELSIPFSVNSSYDLSKAFWNRSYVGGRDMYYDGETFVLPRLMITNNNGTRELTEGEHFRFLGYVNSNGEQVDTINIGTNRARYEGLGNYHGTFDVTFYLMDERSFTNTELYLPKRSFPYTGRPITPTVRVTDHLEQVLDPEKDYEIVFQDENQNEMSGAPTEIGIYYLYVKARSGGKYHGNTRSVSFSITEEKQKLTGVKMEIGSAVSVSLEEGEEWLGIFTAPHEGYYFLYGEGDKDSYGELYSDADLTQMITYSDDREHETNFGIPIKLKKNQTVYLLAFGYDLSSIRFKVKVRELAENDMEFTHIVYDSDHMICSGKAAYPRIMITDDSGKTLTEGVDYDLEYYVYNYETSSYEKIAAITEKGEYMVVAVARKGSGNQKSISLYASGTNDLDYGKITGDYQMFSPGESIHEFLSVYDVTGKKLTAGTDFMLRYYRKDGDTDTQISSEPTEIGNYYVKAEGRNGYQGRTDGYHFVIRNKFDITNSTNITLDSPAFMEKEIPVYMYTGKAVEPKVTVTDLNGKAIKSENYVVSYEDNVEPMKDGKYAKLVVTGGSPYEGTVEKLFKIVKKCNLETLILANGLNLKTGDVEEKVSVSGEFIRCDISRWNSKPVIRPITEGSISLTEGKDYTVSYTDATGKALAGVPVKAGAYRILIKATKDGKCTGGFSFPLYLVEDQSVVISMSGAAVKLGAEKYVYDGKVKSPGVKSVTMNGIPLIEGKDYTVTAPAGRKEVGKYTYTIRGTGRYFGSITADFTIEKGTTTLKLNAQSKTFNGKAQKYTGKVTKTGSTGKITYRYYSDAKGTKEVKAANVKKAGTYYVRASIAADKNYKAATSGLVKLTIKKAKNPMKARLKKLTLKRVVLLKKGKVIRPLVVTRAKGKLAYKLVSVKKKALKKYIVVNKKTGKITVKKGAPKGNYTVRIKVVAKGNVNYKAIKKTVTVKFIVK